MRTLLCMSLVMIACRDKQPPRPDVIASHQVHPQAVVLANGYVYWTVYGTVTPDGRGMPGTISRMKLDGGAVEVVHADQGHPRELAVGGSFLYWADLHNDAIVRAPLAGGAPEVVWPAQERIKALVTAGEFVYWSRHSPGRIGHYEVVRARAPEAPEVVAESHDAPNEIFVAPDAIYFTIYGEGRGKATGEVFRAEFGGTPTSIATRQAGPNALAMVDGRVVWSNCGDDTLVAATSEGKPEILARFPKSSCPSAIAVDGDDVFVATNSDGRVWHVAKGSTKPRLLGQGDLFAEGMAVDASHVYWANNGKDGSVLRARRPK